MKRHADPTLAALEELYGGLDDSATEAVVKRWWTLVLNIEASLDSDPRRSAAERDAMHRLRARVSDVYGALNRGETPNYTAARVALIGLQHSLEQRTVGLDGHRLR